MATKKIENYGVDIILHNLHKNPHCEHGPTILFERFTSKRSSKYYACSACRMRKLCPFYLPYNAKRLKMVNRKQKLKKNKRRKIFKLGDLSKYFFCVTCADVYLISAIKEHSKCKKIEKLNKEDVNFPTKILTPKDNSKFEAQYLFTDECSSQIIKLIKGINAQKVLCIGSPRIFECLKSDDKQSIECLLLDIDERFYSFYSSKEYLRYNLFNHHFFNGAADLDTYKSFLKGGEEKIVVLMDPPFGGRIELIANTLSNIEKEWKQINCFEESTVLSVMLVFPYFLERSINKSLPSFTMLDYQVDYDNHPLYTTGTKGMRNGSAVRIFVNIPANLFPLPNGSYRRCKKCDRWVYKNNIHCSKCQGCMSKDGNTYEHCDACVKCVKPSWIHCSDCKICLPKDHICSQVIPSKCHMCGANGHKRAACPKRRKKGNEKKIKKMQLS